MFLMIFYPFNQMAIKYSLISKTMLDLNIIYMNSLRNKELKEHINLLAIYGFQKERLSPESLPKSITLFASIFKKI